MISKTFRSITVMAIAVGFAFATLASCGAKKEEVVEETPVEEAAPVVEEAPVAPADTTATDTTATQ